MAKVKDKERILKAARETVIYKGAPIRLSTETYQARKNWHEIFKVMKSEYLQPRPIYPKSLACKIEGEIKSFSEKQKLREFVTTKLVPQEMLKGFF